MVHALNEAWRVLIPHGIMIDLRPLCVDLPIDIIFNEKKETAGVMDNSPDMKLEIASEDAIKSAVNEGIYKELLLERFEVKYYWKTVKGMMADIRKRWMDDIILDENVIQKAYQLFRKHRPRARVRVGMEMKLAKYEKQG